MGLIFEKRFQHPATFSWVYLARSKHHALTKIGVASDVDRRLKEMRCTDFTIHCVFKAWAWKPFEKWLHDRYRNSRISGEWFSLSEEDISYISELALAEFQQLCAEGH